MNVQQRDIILIPFPFSDFSAQKVRPAVVVSNDQFNTSSEDVIICAMTSNLSKDQYTVLIEKKDLEEGNLYDDCCVKVESILRADKKIVMKKIGKINLPSHQQIIKKIVTLF